MFFPCRTPVILPSGDIFIHHGCDLQGVTFKVTGFQVRAQRLYSSIPVPMQVSQRRLYFPQVPSHPDPLQGLHLSKVATLVIFFSMSILSGTRTWFSLSLSLCRQGNGVLLCTRNLYSTCNS